MGPKVSGGGEAKCLKRVADARHVGGGRGAGGLRVPETVDFFV